MDLTKKAAYIKGLFDGLEIDPKDKQAKILKQLIDLVNEMADEVSQLEQCYDDVCDQIDAIDEDLSGVEDLLCDEYDGEYDENNCGDCNYCSADSTDTAYEVICPTCGTEIGLTEDSLNTGGIECPECGEAIEFDYDEDELDDKKGSSEE